MKVEISYVPPEEIITLPEEEATYPFELNGDVQYIVDFSCWDGDYHHDELFCNWMNSPDYYPIYSFAEIYDFQQEEYEELFKRQDIEFEYMKGSRNGTFFVKAIIRRAQQFKEYYPYLYGNGGMLNLSLWSTKEDLFRVEEREYESPYSELRTKKDRNGVGKVKRLANAPIVDLTKSSILFWVGHDGDFITAFSKDEHFSTIDSLQDMMPEKFELITDEYE